jgi:hypothetical protein
MAYFVLDPEATGGFGPATVGDLRAMLPRSKNSIMSLIHGL